MLAALLHHPQADIHDVSGTLQAVNELAGQHRPVPGVVKAKKRFAAHNAKILQPQVGLIGHMESNLCHVRHLEAAALLGMTFRSLRYRIKKLNIE